MKVWLIENQRRYNPLLFHLFQQLADNGESEVNEFSSFGSEEVLQRLDSLLFEAENSVHLSVIVDGEEVEFLSALYQLVIRSPYQQNNLRIIIFSTLESWMDTYPNMLPADLGTYFLARKASFGGNAAFRLENCYSQLEASQKIRSNLILLGLLYGGDGLDFNHLLRQMWEAKYPSNFATTLQTRIFPAIHYQRFLQIMTTIVLQNDSPSGFLVPAFDWEPRPLSAVLDRLNQAINYTNPPITTEATEEQKQTTTTTSLPSSSWTIDFSHFYSKVKSPSHSFAPSELESRFPSDWISFLELSGLKTIHILLAGPPKAGKTTIGKEMSDKLQLTYVDLVTSVLALLKYDPTATTLPKHLDATKISNDQLELKTWIENKLMEGKKPGKDKNATEPPPIEWSLITDTFCQSIPAELLRKALSYFFNTDLTIARKGSVLDLWESHAAVFESSLQEFDKIMRLTWLPEQASPVITINIVIELIATEKVILDKQIELIGPANMKSKESQATIKALEGALTTYFSNCSEMTLEDKTFKSHQKVISFEENRQEDRLIVRWNAMPVDVSQCIHELIIAFRNKRSKAFGWLPLLTTPTTETTGEEVVGEDKDDISVLGENENDHPNEQRYQELSTNDKQTKPVAIPEPKLWQEMNPGIQKIDEFLTATLLPVLSKSVIDVVRNEPVDPILYVANYLAEVSRHQQQEAYEHAKKQFEELLKS